MIRRLRAGALCCYTRDDEGQIFPALIVAVLAIVGAAWLFLQVGSAADGKSQAQSAADAAALAGARAFRDGLVASFDSGVPADPFGPAAAAAQRAAVAYADDNNADLDPADVSVTIGPAGNVNIAVANVLTRHAVAAGPATGDKPGPRATASATAAVSLNSAGLCAGALAADPFVVAFVGAFGVTCPPLVAAPPLPGPPVVPPVPPVAPPPDVAPPVPFAPLLSIRLTA